MSQNVFQDTYDPCCEEDGRYTVTDGDKSLNKTVKATVQGTESNEQNLQQQKVIQDNPIFKAAQDNDVDKIKSLIAQGNVDMRKRGAMGETVLHLAHLFNNTEAALELIKADPSTVNLVYEAELYKGEVALHIAIVHRNFTLIDALIRNGADVVNPRATGTFFVPGEECQCYYGEYLLSFAVCTGQIDVVSYLVSRGARLDAKDSLGNTALHMVLYMKHIPKAKAMYDHLLKLGEQHNLDLESITNIDGYTPLKLAARMANAELFDHMLSLRRQVHWVYGPVTSSVYDLIEVDTHDDPNCVIGVMMDSSDQKSMYLVGITPIKQIMHEKWTRFRPWFIAWFFFMVIYMTIYTLVMNYSPKLNAVKTTMQNDNVTHHLAHFGYIYSEPAHYWRAAGEIILLLGVLFMMLLEISDIARIGIHSYFMHGGSGIYNGLLWVYIVCFWIGFILRILCQPREDIVFSIAGLCGWLYILFFTRGFEKTGQFSVMIQKMLVGDLLRFMCVFVIVLIAFCTAFDVIYSKIDPPPDQFSSYALILFNLFKCMVGIEGYESEVLYEPVQAGLLVILFVSYLLLAFVLLSNLLIAMMGDTYAKVAEESEKLWKLQIAEVTLLIERRLSRKLRKRTGVCGGDFGFREDRWYIRVEEYDDEYDKLETQGFTEEAANHIMSSQPHPPSSPAPDTPNSNSKEGNKTEKKSSGFGNNKVAPKEAGLTDDGNSDYRFSGLAAPLPPTQPEEL